MKKQKRIGEIVQQAGLRAVIWNLVLEIILFIIAKTAVAAHHLTTVLNYQLLLHLLLLLLIGIQMITFVVFLTGTLMGIVGQCWQKRGGEET